MNKEHIEIALTNLTDSDAVTLGDSDIIIPMVKEFSVTALPEDLRDHSDAHYFSIRVLWKSKGKWAIQKASGSQIGRHGEEGHESLPSTRTKSYIKNYRFSLSEALVIATEAAKNATLMGMTIDDFIKESEAEKITERRYNENQGTSREAFYYDVLEALEPSEVMLNRIAKGRARIAEKSGS